MNLFQSKIDRIKNLQRQRFFKDFNYSAVSFMVLALFILAGVLIQGAAVTGTSIIDSLAVGAAFLLAALAAALIPMWVFIMQLLIIIWIGVFVMLSSDFLPIMIISSAGLVISASFELIYQWDKVVVLRLGKFRKVHGPGLFVLIPFIDRIAASIDTRIRATDFSAEKTITSDTVPVHVDALAFWMIWDPKKAVLEVENYIEAVILSAQTALRDAIGRHELSYLLSERDDLGKEIQQILDKKTNPWGVTILSIEITDIIIPKELENAMSKQAQAERERKSRVILSTAEVEIAKKFKEAAETYDESPTALQLRAMNMVYEGIRQNSSLMLLPSSALDQMNLGTVLGSAAYNKTQQKDVSQTKENTQPTEE
jgi:regulator of protease activity HflC (stomatin/prohibitin superfamily)